MKVFIYGTLLRGCSRHGYHLHGQKFVGEDRTTVGFALLNIFDFFPGMTKVSGDSYVVGEVYEVDEDCMLGLDYLEVVPHMYIRETIVLQSGQEVETYLWNQDRRHEQITSGSWRKHIEESSSG